MGWGSLVNGTWNGITAQLQYKVLPWASLHFSERLHVLVSYDEK